MIHLTEMREVFQKFLLLLLEEECVLLRMDRQRVADITEKKEQVFEEMCRYEQQITATLQQLAGLENLECLEGWLIRSSHPQVVSAKKVFQELHGLALKIQEQGRKNGAVIRRTQHVVREAINLIYTGLGTGPVYQGSGALQFSSVPSSVNLHG